MSSTTSGRTSIHSLSNKKLSTPGISQAASTMNTKRAVSHENIIQTPITQSTSYLNCTNLPEKSSPTHLETNLNSIVRSRSSTNADLDYHLQQLKHLSQLKGSTNHVYDGNHRDNRIHLTSSNLKIECNENTNEGKSIHTTMHVETIEATIPVPKTWQSTKQQTVLERDSWNHKSEFLLSVIGYAVDLGNVWRFPTSVCMNGGGVFFIPYFILLIFGGLPLFYMELALGQYHRSGIFTVWKHICPLVKGVGWATVIINFMMAMFYNTIIAWAVYYLFMSFNGIWSELPWKSCHHSWNSECCVPADVSVYEYLSKADNSTKSNSIETSAISGLLLSKMINSSNCNETVYSTEDYFYQHVQEINLANKFDNLGKVKWELALCLFIVFIFVYFALWKGIRSSGKAVWITAVAPYAVLLVLLIRGITLSGASIGIHYYLYPKLELLKSFPIWNAAATQIFFSLGPGFGALLALSSYNKFHNNCYRDAMVTSTINCATSILAGFVVFSTLGHMAYVSKKPIEEVIKNKGSELIFIVYPHTIALMKWSTLWAILFFFMLITLGIDSTFGGLESIITGLCDEFPHLFGHYRSLLVLGVLIISYVGALPTCTYGGDYIVSLMNEIAVAPAILLVVFVECVAVSWFYGVNRFSNDIKAMIGTQPSLFWRSIWYIVSPMFLLMIFYISMDNLLFGPVKIKDIDFRNAPLKVQICSYLMVFVPMSCIPIYAIYKLIITPGQNFDDRLQRSMKPEEQFFDCLNARENEEQQQNQREAV